MNLYRKYDYQGLELNVDSNLDDQNTIKIRVNPYKQKGQDTYRALLMDFKETTRPMGPE